MTHERSCRSPRGTTYRGGSIARSSRGLWLSIVSGNPKLSSSQTSSRTASFAKPIASMNRNLSQPERSLAQMFDRNYYATHPDMMECVSNEELRDRYLVQDLFREGEVVLNYTHADRLVIGGVFVGTGEVRLPDQAEPASAVG